MFKTVKVPASNSPVVAKNNEISVEFNPADLDPTFLKDAVADLLEGTKQDTNKPRFDLISPEWEEQLAIVMQHGANKYADRNWEKGISVSRCYAALRRHVNAFLKGEEIDPESGLHHLAHANANLMFLWAMPTIKPEKDDRVAVKIIP